MFAELCCYSNFSFLTGASHPEEYVREAKKLNYQGLGITDEASVSGSVRAHLEATASQIPLIHGAYFQTEERIGITLFAPTREAWGELCQIISLARRRANKGSYRIATQDLIRRADALLCLWHPDPQNYNWTEQTQAIRYAFRGRFWIAAHLPEFGGQAELADRLDRMAFKSNLPVVATQRPLMHSRKRLKLQHTLTAIRLNSTLSNVVDQLERSSERSLLNFDALTLSLSKTMAA